MEPFIAPAYGQTTEAIKAAAQAGDSLLGMGPFGALLLLLLIAGGVVIYVLWGSIKERDRAIESRDEVIRQLQDKRADEAKFWADRVATVATTSSSAMAELSATVKDLTRDLETISDQAKLWAPAVEAITKLLDRNGTKMDELHLLVQRGVSRDR